MIQLCPITCTQSCSVRLKVYSCFCSCSVIPQLTGLPHVSQSLYTRSPTEDCGTGSRLLVNSDNALHCSRVHQTMRTTCGPGPECGPGMSFPLFSKHLPTVCCLMKQRGRFACIHINSTGCIYRCLLVDGWMDGFCILTREK